jgi:large subunit ribosomal protein L4
MQVNLYNQKAEEVGKLELSDAVFNVPMNRDLVYQVAVSQRSNQRQTIAHAKGRSEVRGGGKKPWQQKGTGRARHGSIRSPIWKGGGVTHGPTKEANFKKKINVKMARKAVATVLSSKVRDGQFALLEGVTLGKPKTKEMAMIATSLNSIFNKDAKKQSRMLLVVPSVNVPMQRAASNIPNVDMIEARNLNTLMLLEANNIVMFKDSVDVIQKMLS